MRDQVLERHRLGHRRQDLLGDPLGDLGPQALEGDQEQPDDQQRHAHVAEQLADQVRSFLGSVVTAVNGGQAQAAPCADRPTGCRASHSRSGGSGPVYSRVSWSSCWPSESRPGKVRQAQAGAPKRTRIQPATAPSSAIA